MRISLLLVALLLLPTVGALALPFRAPMLPDDLSDGDLVRLIAGVEGVPTRQAIHIVPSDSLGNLVERVALRVGKHVEPSERAAFDALDPRVQAPALVALTAIDQAWVLNQQAFATSTLDKRSLYAAGILILDAVDAQVIPLARSASEAGVWPATPVADSVGILRIGGSGTTRRP